jgi:hypothetical protein
MGEVKNQDPFGINLVHQAPGDIQTQLSIVMRDLSKNSLTLSPFACMPFASQEELVNSIIGPRQNGHDYSERPRQMINAFKEYMPPEAVAYPVTNTAIHWTTGVQSSEESFKLARLQTALMPFFFIYTENRPPYQNNSDETTNYHSGIRARRALGQRGLYPDFLFAVKDHNEFKDRTIQRVLKSPMMAFYNYEGAIDITPRGVTLTPENMQGYGPENISQFEMAMSQLWYFYKLKGITGGEGTLFERRDFDSGPEVFQDLALVFNMLDFEPSACDQLIDILDKKYGIPVFEDPIKADGVIRHNLEAALHRGHQGKRFVDTPFGDPQLGKTVHGFLKNDLLPMMEDHYAGTPQNEGLESWRFKAEYKTTNAQFWYDQFQSMDEQRGVIAELTSEPEYHERYLTPQSWAQQMGRVLTPNTA